MRITIYEPVPIDPIGQHWLIDPMAFATKWTVFALWLVAPFIGGLLAGLIFNRVITRRGWRTNIIPVWAIPVMFGTLAYVVAPALLFIVLSTFVHFQPLAIFAGLAFALFYTWPIWLLMGPVTFIYINYLKNRRKWLRDSTVAYLSIIALTSECAFLWFWDLFGRTSPSY
ncbi:hypothetical protein [Bradyrhizobium sp. BR 10289]|uniref:hypothetical protein n=1 Tax=Bradyrhizobium sp. BR 10289 TaxID=2749993 RepID=UPI001C645331|nr:hypothetical protein [Bradyrhizobium sp. BR 10289]MBW7973215.1 hypothetical protein [Bradyrhizobium sp. BR 10289]